MENPPELWEEGSEESPKPSSYPIADIVSLETIVNLLIRKGICTPEELYEEEQRVRQDRQTAEPTPTPMVARTLREPLPVNGSKRKSSWLKRKMSKKRWSRRLGTFLFGWEWRKVKTTKSGEEGIEPQE